MEKCEQQRWATVTTSSVIKTWKRTQLHCTKHVLFLSCYYSFLQNCLILGKINYISNLYWVIFWETRNCETDTSEEGSFIVSSITCNFNGKSKLRKNWVHYSIDHYTSLMTDYKKCLTSNYVLGIMFFNFFCI